SERGHRDRYGLPHPPIALFRPSLEAFLQEQYLSASPIFSMIYYTRLPILRLRADFYFKSPLVGSLICT
ncbi:hypothetical protein, partial [Xanthomonas phaseoli]|uniref:hypothetical protein n=1 Tax=Xanthomonas phaseoli TaxID=1985254 RepID=UPI001ADCC812